MAEETVDVMDRDSRMDAALEAFSEPAEDPNAASTEGATDPNASQEQDGAEDPNAREQQQPEATGELTDEQRQADPQFQQLSEFKDQVENVFAEFNIPDANEAKLQLSDAQVLYQIAQGQAPPSQLLDLFAQNWNPEQVKGVADNLIGWLTAKGFLKDGQGAAPKSGDPNFKDPLAARLDKIENDGKTQREREAAQAEEKRRADIFTNKYLPAVEGICKQKSIPQEDYQQYSDAIAKLINGNAMVLKRIENGNYVDINRYFAQVHNAEVARLTRYNKAQMAAQQKKQGNPRIPSGGAPPAPVGSAKKVNSRDRDSRIAAATDML